MLSRSCKINSTIIKLKFNNKISLKIKIVFFNVDLDNCVVDKINKNWWKKLVCQKWTSLLYVNNIKKDDALKNI